MDLEYIVKGVMEWLFKWVGRWWRKLKVVRLGRKYVNWDLWGEL